MQHKDVLSLKEFCEYANISDEHGYKLTRTGKLKFYSPFGKKIYIHRKDAEEALMKNPVMSQSNIESKSIENTESMV